MIDFPIQTLLNGKLFSLSLELERISIIRVQHNLKYHRSVGM